MIIREFLFGLTNQKHRVVAFVLWTLEEDERECLDIIVLMWWDYFCLPRDLGTANPVVDLPGKYSFYLPVEVTLPFSTQPKKLESAENQCKLACSESSKSRISGAPR